MTIFDNEPHARRRRVCGSFGFEPPERTLEQEKHILLHACCAPCSPHVIRTLADQGRLTVFFYNPNIHGRGEYELRLGEIRRLCDSLGVKLVEGPYDPERFFELVGPYSDSGERGERCSVCFRMRLEEAFRLAGELGADEVTTTLTVSPHKDSAQVHEAGNQAAGEGEILFRLDNFKKRDGYRIACELSEQYGFYRQDYCGCTYSRQESERKNAERADQGG